MKAATRQRLIGLGLLILLLLILVPWGLQTSDELTLQLDSDIPAAPEIQWQPITPPIAPEKTQAVNEQITQERQQNIASTLDEEKPLVAYAVELASYTSRTAGVKMRQKLNDAGYSAYLRDKDGSTTLYLGPELDKKRMQKVRQQLKKNPTFEFSESKLVTYQP